MVTSPRPQGQDTLQRGESYPSGADLPVGGPGGPVRRPVGPWGGGWRTQGKRKEKREAAPPQEYTFFIFLPFPSCLSPSSSIFLSSFSFWGIGSRRTESPTMARPRMDLRECARRGLLHLWYTASTELCTLPHNYTCRLWFYHESMLYLVRVTAPCAMLRGYSSGFLSG